MVRNGVEAEDGSLLPHDLGEMLSFVFCSTSDFLVGPTDNDESGEDFVQPLHAHTNQTESFQNDPITSFNAYFQPKHLNFRIPTIIHYHLPNLLQVKTLCL